MERDRDVIEVLNEIVGRKPRWGFWKLHDRLRLEGCRINHKRLHRVYCEMGLNLPRRTRRRLPVRTKRRLRAPSSLNVIWAADFMTDALYGGRWFRTFNVIDEGNRQAQGIEVGHTKTQATVKTGKEQLIEMHGKPTALRVDNGAEFTAHAFTEWCEQQKIELFYIEPGKPDQNAFVERFNRTYREEVLDAYLFDSLEQVRDITELWIPDYNEERPHDSLGCVLPLTYKPRQTPAESTSELCA